MQLYTLNSAFLKEDVIDKFSSAIWTERYSAPGDVTLEVDPTPEMISMLSEGTFLALEDSDEVMLLDTQIIENGRLKVQGESLLGFLRNRSFLTLSDLTARSWYAQGFLPENLIAHVVLYCAVVVDANGDTLLYNGVSNYTVASEDFSGAINRNRIPNLSIDSVSSPYAPVNYSVPHGQVLDVIKQVAETFSLGIRLYLYSADVYDFDLRFRVYSGIDRSEQVQFSPLLDSLTNVKELRSNRDYKTVAVAWPNDPDLAFFAVAYVPGTEDFYGFDRRMLLVYVDDVYLDKIAVDPEMPQTADYDNAIIVLEQRARDALANNNYVKVVDGEVVPQSEFQYGTHYHLGDIVGLRGYSDIVQKARITEYIRSQDSTGERSYPTVSVID